MRLSERLNPIYRKDLIQISQPVEEEVFGSVSREVSGDEISINLAPNPRNQTLTSMIAEEGILFYLKVRRI